MPGRLLTMRETAKFLGRTYEWFRRKRADLIAEAGFPQPVKGMGNCWDQRAIERWLDRQSEPTAASVLVDTDWDDLLDQRIGAL